VFAKLGFETASLSKIAEKANVDYAVISHCFGPQHVQFEAAYLPRGSQIGQSSFGGIAWLRCTVDGK
jgi:hypothetical protein